MKKIFSILLISICILGIQDISQAQEIQKENIGIGDIIFIPSPENIENNFSIDEVSYSIIQEHLTIAGIDIKTSNYQEETLMTIKKIEELTKTDIIGILNISTDKKEALAKYLHECDENLQKGDSISAYMRQDMNILKQDMQACIDEKNITDKAYFDAIDRYDQKIMETSLKESISYENCAIENRIQYNAKTSIIQKLVFYL
ncbi:MAG: hypothetical protein WCL02_04430 [bacterium]